MVLVSLLPPAGSVRYPNPEAVAGVLWAYARPGDGLEHVRAAPGEHDGSLRFALFLAPSGAPPPAAASALFRRAIQSSPLLAGFGFDVVNGALGGLSERFGPGN